MDVVTGDYVLTRIMSLHGGVSYHCSQFELCHSYNIVNPSIQDEFRSYQKNLCRSSMKLINRTAFRVVALDRVHHICKYGLTVDDNDEDLYFGDPSKGVYIDLNIDQLLEHNNKSDYIIVAVCKIFWWIKGHCYVYSYDMCPKLPPKELFAIHRSQKWPSKIYLYQYCGGNYLQSPHNILPYQLLVFRRTGSTLPLPDLRLFRPIGETNGDRPVDRPHPRLRVEMVDLHQLFSFEEMSDFWVTDECFRKRLQKLDSFRYRFPAHLARQFRIIKGSEPASPKLVSAETSCRPTKNGHKTHVVSAVEKRESREEAKQMNGHGTIVQKEAPLVVVPKRKRRWNSGGDNKPRISELISEPILAPIPTSIPEPIREAIEEHLPSPALVYDELKVVLNIPPCDPPRIPSPPPIEAPSVSKAKKRKKTVSNQVPVVQSPISWPPMIPLDVEAKPVTHQEVDVRLWRLVSRLTYEEQSYITDPRINRHLIYYVERDRAEKYNRQVLDSKPCSTSGVAFASHLVREFDSFNDSIAVQSQEVSIPTQKRRPPLLPLPAISAVRTPSPTAPVENAQRCTTEDNMSTVALEAQIRIDGAGFNQAYAINNGKCRDTRLVSSTLTRANESPHSPPSEDWQGAKSPANPSASERKNRSTNGGKRPKLDIGDMVPANLLPYYVRRNSYVVWRPIGEEEYTQLRSQRPSRFDDEENFAYLDRVASFAADKKPYLRDLAEEEIQKLYHERIELAKERDFREKEVHLKSIDDLVRKYKDLIQKNC